MPKKIDSGAILKVGFNTPFSEQLDFFRQKLNLPTEHWDDIMRESHDRAFVVAGAMKADLLADLNGAVGKAIAEGKSIGWFRKEFAAIVGKHGWQGWTGEGSPEGFAWRTRVIYQTNLSTSYAAGRYRQLTDPELLSVRPYWRYKHADGVANPRLQHVAWNGLTLPHDHPFWQTHFPPNGWGCHCRVVAVNAREYAKSQAAGQAEPPAGWDAIDGKTGEPVGIAKGFGYAPGASVVDEMRALVEAKSAALPPALGKALADDVAANAPRIAKSVAEAGRIAKEIIDQQTKAWPLDVLGKEATRFSHPGCSTRDEIRSKKFGVASWTGLNVETANAGNAWLLKAQAEAGRLGLPRLRGVNTSPGAGAAGSMGDGILSVTKHFDVTVAPLQPPTAYKLSDGKAGRPGSTAQYFATNKERMEKTMWHEFGHHIHQTFHVNGDRAAYLSPPLESRLYDLIRSEMNKAGGPQLFDFPSEYAKKNHKEYFAECYCLHKMGRPDLVPAFMQEVIAKIEKGQMP